MSLSGHWQTIIPALFRRVPVLTRQHERLELDDGDFLDLQWHRQGRDKLVILSHGLEGSANATYIQGMARALSADGWDVLAWNCRSCSGEMNRLKRFYHSGVSDDLKAVVDHALTVHHATEVALIGFSLGGNVTLKYLGEECDRVSKRLIAGVAFSVPCDLASSSKELGKWLNRKLYMRQFISSLIRKVEMKSQSMDLGLDLSGLSGIKTFKDFDDRFTAPLHGFESAEDYWERASSRPLLTKIRIPTLLAQAANDPFLAGACFPHEEAKVNPAFQLQVTDSGGHVGFGVGRDSRTWAEERAVAFLVEHSTNMTGG